MTMPSVTSATASGVVTTTSPGSMPGAMLAVSIVMVRWPSRWGPAARTAKARTATATSSRTDQRPANAGAARRVLRTAGATGGSARAAPGARSGRTAVMSVSGSSSWGSAGGGGALDAGEGEGQGAGPALELVARGRGQRDGDGQVVDPAGVQAGGPGDGAVAHRGAGVHEGLGAAADGRHTVLGPRHRAGPEGQLQAVDLVGGEHAGDRGGHAQAHRRERRVAVVDQGDRAGRGVPGQEAGGDRRDGCGRLGQVDGDGAGGDLGGDRGGGVGEGAEGAQAGDRGGGAQDGQGAEDLAGGGAGAGAHRGSSCWAGIGVTR